MTFAELSTERFERSDGLLQAINLNWTWLMRFFVVTVSQSCGLGIHPRCFLHGV